MAILLWNYAHGDNIVFIFIYLPWLTLFLFLDIPDVITSHVK